MISDSNTQRFAAVEVGAYVEWPMLKVIKFNTITGTKSTKLSTARKHAAPRISSA